MEKLKKLVFKGILQALIIVAAGIIIGLAANTLRADRLELAKSNVKQPAQSSQQTGQQANAITKISVWEGFEAFRSGSAIFLDARSEYDFNVGHIPHAHNIPPGKRFTMESKNPKAKSKLIITYCQGRDCPLADELAKAISAAGFTNIKVMPEGWEAWSQSGYPVESGR
jgi:rhodanese-related sulfurtransferase